MNTNTHMLSDELLCAYLDGELSPQERATLEAQLLAEPGARVRLDRFREADERLRRAFALDAHVADTSLPDQLQVVQQQPTNAIPTPYLRRYLAPTALALAATVAGIAIGVGWRQQSENVTSQGLITAALHSALDTLPSGAEDGGTRLLLSFRKQDGTPCRQFETIYDGRSAEGVACRSGQRWTIIALNGLKAGGAEGYRTAGGESSLDEVIDDIDATGALSLAEEGRLIASGW